MAVVGPEGLPKGRWVGLDVGKKTIGLAISDPEGTLATSLTTLHRTKLKADLTELKKLIKEREAVALVVGLPLNMDGTEGPRCQSVRRFVEDMLKFIDMPVAFWDERLSTVSATETLIEGDVSRDKRKQVVDKVAASYILQSILENRKNLTKQ